MNKKIIISSLLLLTLALAGCNSQANSQNAEVKETAPENQQENKKEVTKVDKIEVIDFHGSRRCYSCQTIEKYTKETLEEFFQPELRDGIITFQSINVEEEQNKAIVEKYQARGSSLFINPIVDGEDNIAEDIQVWRLLANERNFKQYLKTKIDNLLK